MINRDHLKFGFDEGSLPQFLCPRCNLGQLTPTSPLESFFPPYSKDIYSEEWADWSHIELRLSATLRCANPKCGEQASLYATGGVEPNVNSSGSYTLENFFRIRSITPSPHIISLPSSLPEALKKELLASFDAYWSHKNLSANAIRNCLEAFLAHFGVPDEIAGKWVPLGKRIATYAEDQPVHANFFSLLRPIMNSSSHGDTIETDVLLDVYEALEIFLAEVFDARSQRFEVLTNRLRENQSPKVNVDLE